MRRALLVPVAAAAASLGASPSGGGTEAILRCSPLPVRETRGAVEVVRHGERVRAPDVLVRGDRVRVGRRALLAVAAARVRDARLAVGCDRGFAALDVRRGRVELVRATLPEVLTPEAAVRGLHRGRVLVRRPLRGRRTLLRLGPGAYASVFARRHRRGELLARPREDVVVDRGRAPRRDVDPFPRSFEQRAVRASDRLPSLWAGTGACARRCRPRARPGWPLRPFHRPHPIRAGLNEKRPGSLHVGVDIQSVERARVYALQGGRAHVEARGTVDVRVRVGAFEYWHVRPRVREGQVVRAYATVVGRVIAGFRHVHLSERRGEEYLNPLRPAGRVLAPWADYAAPVIGRPYALGGGRLAVRGYDPQSYAERLPYHTPVLMPAGLAWRVRPHGVLRFAYRGVRHLPFSARHAVFAPGAYPPGFTCFATRRVCVPQWRLVLAGGFAPRLRRGTHRLTVYAWDWAGNRAARDVTVAVR